MLHQLAGVVGAGYLHLVGKTSFVQKRDHPKFLELYRNRAPLIYSFWHNSQVFLAYTHRDEGIHTLVSLSKDGEYIAQVMRRFGTNAVRGSTSRGGEQALRELCSKLEEGGQAGFTPDGPRGPLQTVHGGVIMAAQRTGAPIVPLTCVSRRRIVFNSWDKFVVPLPFSSIVVAHGEPLYIPKDMEVDAAKELLRRAMNANVDDANQFFVAAPSWIFSFAAEFLSRLYTVAAYALAPAALPVVMALYGAKRTFHSLGERFVAGDFPRTPGRRLWFHAASVGEWQALRPVLTHLKSQVAFDCVITTSTPETRALVEREFPEAAARMLPLDLPWVLRRWIARVDPAALVIVETELWPNLIRVLYQKSVPVILINGRLSRRSAGRWKFFKPLAHKIMSGFSALFVRTEADGRRFFQLGAPLSAIQMTGNTKYDNLALADEDFRRAARKKYFGEIDGIVVIAGSTWPGEEDSLLKLMREKSVPRFRLIVAPRRARRFNDVAKLLEASGVPWSYWSRVKESKQWTTDILLVDTLGDLKNLYAASDIAFVGGSLTVRGGQNPLEPAATGLPVLFGSSMENFLEEAAELKRAGAARQARHEKDLLSDIRELASDENTRRTMGLAAARFIKDKQGASARTADGIRKILGL